MGFPTPSPEDTRHQRSGESFPDRVLDDLTRKPFAKESATVDHVASSLHSGDLNHAAAIASQVWARSCSESAATPAAYARGRRQARNRAARSSALSGSGIKRACKCGRITLGNACRRRNQGGQTRAERLVDVETICLVTHRADENVRGAEDQRNVASKAEELDGTAEFARFGRRLPARQRRSRADDRQPRSSRRDRRTSRATRPAAYRFPCERLPTRPTNTAEGRSSFQPSRAPRARRAAGVGGRKRSASTP